MGWVLDSKSECREFGLVSVCSVREMTGKQLPRMKICRPQGYDQGTIPFSAETFL